MIDWWWLLVCAYFFIGFGIVFGIRSGDKSLDPMPWGDVLFFACFMGLAWGIGVFIGIHEWAKEKILRWKKNREIIREYWRTHE